VRRAFTGRTYVGIEGRGRVQNRDMAHNERVGLTKAVASKRVLNGVVINIRRVGLRSAKPANKKAVVRDVSRVGREDKRVRENAMQDAINRSG